MCEKCELVRGPKTIKMVKRDTGTSLNFDLDKVPQFESIPVPEGTKTVEVYHCKDVYGYKEAWVTVVGIKD